MKKTVTDRFSRYRSSLGSRSSHPYTPQHIQSAVIARSRPQEATRQPPTTPQPVKSDIRQHTYLHHSAHFRVSENARWPSKMLAGVGVNRKCLVRLCRALAFKNFERNSTTILYKTSRKNQYAVYSKKRHSKFFIPAQPDLAFSRARRKHIFDLTFLFHFCVKTKMKTRLVRQITIEGD